MQKYVLSSKIETGCPVGLAEDYGLFDKFYDDIKNARRDIGSFPWYSNSRECELPVSACYITKLKKIDFGIRSISSGLYMVSEDFLKIMVNREAKYSLSSEIEVRNKDGKRVADTEYYIARFLEFPASDIIDLTRSNYIQHETRIQIKQLVCKSEFIESIFQIDGLIGEQSTLFCSKSFRDASLKGGIKGIDYFLETEANWQTMTSFLENAGKKEPKNTVWPI